MEGLRDYSEKRLMVNCLLFISIFMVHIQADCPRPQGTLNIVLTNDVLLKNDFPDGTTVSAFECAHGYEVDTGSGEVTCNDGKWTAPELVCKKKNCGPPPQQEHMTFDDKDGTLFGAKVKVICAKGFQVEGTTYKQCYASGWGGRATCEVITCETPVNITNGRHTWTSGEEPEYGTSIQYSCYDGFTLDGKSSIVCSDEGEYDAQPPKCRANTEPSTKDTITTTRMMSTTPTTFQGGNDILAKGTTTTGTTTDTPVTPTIHTDKTSTTTPISTSTPTVPGGKHILPTTDVNKLITTTGSTLATPTQGYVVPNSGSGHAVVIASVISTVLVVLILLGMAHWCHTRKGRTKEPAWISMNSSQQTPRCLRSPNGTAPMPYPVV